MSFKDITVLLEITKSCNLNCRHCYTYNLAFDTNLFPNDLSLDQIKLILKRIGAQGISNLVLSGGEPFLRKDIFEIIDYAGNYGFESIVINTNGILLNDLKIINQIKKRLDVITAIVVSIDGATNKTHDYIRGQGQFVNLLRILEKIEPHEELPLGINVTLGKWNIHEFNDFFTIYNRFNAFYMNFGLFIPIGHGLKIKEQLLSPKECSNLIHMTEEKRKSGYNVDLCSVPYSNLINKDISGYCCNIFTDFITITAQGHVIPCIMYDFNCGSLLKSDFNINEIFNHPLAQIYQDPSKLKEKMKGKCRDCSEFSICKGGCNLLTLSVKNDMFDSDPLCPLEFLFDNDF
ncbi:MAG: radical SAM protein [Candidatus Helarchaeota archaeon]|nr:radical SAM protein [Candidatus Helarchaeota archaeon]